MSETLKGCVTKGDRPKRSIYGRATLAEQRLGVSLLCLICDRPDIQPRLPQVVLCARKAVRRSELGALGAHAPPNARVWHADSSWTNEDSMKLFFKEVKTALAPVAETYQPILFLDAATQHWTPNVLRSAAAHGFWVVIIPAATTWLLQPCDVYVFKQMKAFVRQKLQVLREHAVDGMVDVPTWLRVVTASFRGVLQSNDWGPSFARLGLTGRQDELGERLVERIGQPSGAPSVGHSGRPSRDDLRPIFPRRKQFSHSALFQHIPVTTVPRLRRSGSSLSARATEVAVGAGEDSQSSRPAVPDREEWLRRLRPCPKPSTRYPHLQGSPSE